MRVPPGGGMDGVKLGSFTIQDTTRRVTREYDKLEWIGKLM
jgi:hypothetical protein